MINRESRISRVDWVRRPALWKLTGTFESRSSHLFVVLDGVPVFSSPLRFRDHEDFVDSFGGLWIRRSAELETEHEGRQLRVRCYEMPYSIYKAPPSCSLFVDGALSASLLLSGW